VLSRPLGSAKSIIFRNFAKGDYLAAAARHESKYPPLAGRPFCSQTKTPSLGELGVSRLKINRGITCRITTTLSRFTRRINVKFCNNLCPPAFSRFVHKLNPGQNWYRMDRLCFASDDCCFVSNHCVVAAHGSLTIMLKPLFPPNSGFFLRAEQVYVAGAFAPGPRRKGLECKLSLTALELVFSRRASRLEFFEACIGFCISYIDNFFRPEPPAHPRASFKNLPCECCQDCHRAANGGGAR
jgi:hypothetical protein